MFHLIFDGIYFYSFILSLALNSLYTKHNIGFFNFKFSVELPRRVQCTACGRQVNPAHGTVCRHPNLNVLVCKVSTYTCLVSQSLLYEMSILKAEKKIVDRYLFVLKQFAKNVDFRLDFLLSVIYCCAETYHRRRIKFFLSASLSNFL